MNKKIAITTGDLKGIGEEVVLKALLKLNLPKENVVIVGRDLQCGYKTIEIDQEDNGEFCYKSLETTCSLANENKIQAIVTAPVSKEVLHKSGYKFNGQTEILEKFLAKDNEKAEMLFIARDLRVLLLTRHVAIKNLTLDKTTVKDKILRLNKFLKEKLSIEKPKLALCAFNPHSGENGILGVEEIEILNPVAEELRLEGVDVTNAMPADALFGKIGKKYIKSEPQEYSSVISCYHDQALCAVKALAFDEVVNTTIGLKVIRTSPSHGTAYDIKGLGVANPESTIQAIKLALQLA